MDINADYDVVDNVDVVDHVDDEVDIVNIPMPREIRIRISYFEKFSDKEFYNCYIELRSNWRTHTIVKIENLFGIWKRRFPIMGYGCRMKLDNALAVIVATAVLHNIARINGEPMPPDAASPPRSS
ncbi:hypothetical protein FQR65_LT11718 [Abscondita terminalis]|nr:hypothetical protein FQR65_LT11718 [Abscondita terminalis]